MKQSSTQLTGRYHWQQGLKMREDREKLSFLLRLEPQFWRYLRAKNRLNLYKELSVEALKFAKRLLQDLRQQLNGRYVKEESLDDSIALQYTELRFICLLVEEYREFFQYQRERKVRV